MVSKWLWPGNRTLLEVASMVVTWWIVAFLPSDQYHDSSRWLTLQVSFGFHFKRHWRTEQSSRFISLLSRSSPVFCTFLSSAEDFQKRKFARLLSILKNVYKHLTRWKALNLKKTSLFVHYSWYKSSDSAYVTKYCLTFPKKAQTGSV